MILIIINFITIPIIDQIYYIQHMFNLQLINKYKTALFLTQEIKAVFYMLNSSLKIMHQKPIPRRLQMQDEPSIFLIARSR